jgi:hypothetical protein
LDYSISGNDPVLERAAMDRWLTRADIIGVMTSAPWPAFAAALSLATSLAQTPPVPKPFPQPSQPPPVGTVAQPPQTPQQPAQPAPAPAGVPNAATLGVQPYPTAEYIDSFDAGKGQRYYLFGTNAAYAEIVGYYRNLMRNGGRTLLEGPAMQQWDLGKFQEQTMAYPPSVVVKGLCVGRIRRLPRRRRTAGKALQDHHSDRAGAGRHPLTTY